MNEEREKAYFKMGEENERIFTPIFKEKFGNDLRKTSHHLSVLDFESPTHFVELKSRTNNYNSFSETMIGDNKRKMAMKKIEQGKKVFFVFSFKDGTYFWELTPENFNNIGGMNQIRIGGTNGRGYDDFKPHLYIPINALTKLTDKGSWSNSIEKFQNIGCWLKPTFEKSGAKNGIRIK